MRSACVDSSSSTSQAPCELAALLAHTAGPTGPPLGRNLALAQVRAFLSAPAKSEKGLPKRPVVGTAISIQLNLDNAQVAEWFGAGYE